MINLKGRSFLTLLDFTPAEIQYLLNLSLWIKRGKFAGNEERKLVGKSVCLLFQKDSTRTRSAFENAAGDQGAHTVYFGPTGSHFAKKESVKDSAKVLGQMFDGIQFRGFKQEDAEKLAKYSGVPVWNGLTDEYHPTQILADFLTILELRGSLRGKKLAFFGDAKNNMGNSLMIGAAKMGMHFVCVAPKKYWPEEKLIKKCKEIAKRTDAQFTFTEDPKEGAKGSDVFYTDVWVSLGEPESVWEERIKNLEKYRVTVELMKLGKPDAIFLHCLPAFHDLETDVGKAVYKKFGIKEMEVSDELFNSKYSHVFQQAGNRLHTIKAVVLATIG